MKTLVLFFWVIVISPTHPKYEQLLKQGDVPVVQGSKQSVWDPLNLSACAIYEEWLKEEVKQYGPDGKYVKEYWSKCYTIDFPTKGSTEVNYETK